MIEIEKLTKTPVTRASLSLPDAVLERPRSHERDNTRGSRERGARPSYGSRGYAPPAPPVDPFFTQPYVPASSAEPVQASAGSPAKSTSTGKKTIGILLGGPKKSAS